MQSVLLVRPRVKDDKVLCKLCHESLPVTAFDPDKFIVEVAEEFPLHSRRSLCYL